MSDIINMLKNERFIKAYNEYLDFVLEKKLNEKAGWSFLSFEKFYENEFQLLQEGYEMSQIIPLYRCPCCDKITLIERYDFEICGNCGWEDDGEVGANSHSLEEARKIVAERGYYQRCGE